MSTKPYVARDPHAYPALDKRTKEYKQWLASQTDEPSGLGDVVEKITEATGIKAVVKFVAGDDCGCDQRKKKLNQLFPNFKPECLTEDEYNYLSQEMKIGRNVVDVQTQRAMIAIYNRVFHQNKTGTSCGACFAKVYNSLRRLIDEYN